MSVPNALADVDAYLRERLQQPLPGPVAQTRFAPRPLRPGWEPWQRPESARQAAALILLYPHLSQVALPLTVRDRSLPQHAGQISLPGGAIDPGESIAAAALREAEEEIGVPGREVRVVGALSPLWIPISNFVVTPVVGVLDRTPTFVLRAGEVAHLIELPLGHLRDRSHVKWARRERRGEPIDYPLIDIDGHAIWGATAMMLAEFTCLFDSDHAPPPR